MEKKYINIILASSALSLVVSCLSLVVALSSGGGEIKTNTATGSGTASGQTANMPKGKAPKNLPEQFKPVKSLGKEFFVKVSKGGNVEQKKGVSSVDEQGTGKYKIKLGFESKSCGIEGRVGEADKQTGNLKTTPDGKDIQVEITDASGGKRIDDGFFINGKC